MIGHYLLTLTPEQEGRVLEKKMGGPYNAYVNDRWNPTCGCLKGVVHNYNPYLAGHDAVGRWGGKLRGFDVVGQRFDRLCVRFGIERTTAAIRNRILSNQARRVLTPEHEYAMVLR